MVNLTFKYPIGSVKQNFIPCIFEIWICAFSSRSDLCFVRLTWNLKVVLSFISWTYVVKLIRKLIKSFIWDKIKRLIKNCTNFLILHEKALLQIIFLCPFPREKGYNVTKSLISHKIQEKWDGKVTARYKFQNKCYFPILFDLYC